MKDDHRRILIAGDLCPVHRLEPRFLRGDMEFLDPRLLRLFHESDLAIANLECPLDVRQETLPTLGPRFGARPGCVAGLRSLGLGAVNLANNHVRDQGEEGVENTVRVLREHGIAPFGAGRGICEANRPVFLSAGDVRVALWGAAAHEFSIAGARTWGANPIDLLGLHTTIPAIKAEADYLVVLLHTGLADYPYPSPRIQRLCRTLARLGADAVICQHSHTAGAVEEYEGSFICYGQGDFAFDRPSKRAAAESYGYLVAIDLAREEGKIRHSVTLQPFRQVHSDASVRALDDRSRMQFESRIRKWSEDVSDPMEVERRWGEHVQRSANDYLLRVTTGSRIIRRLGKIFPFSSALMTRRRKMVLLNMLRCEEHHEMLQAVLEAELRRS